MHKNSRVKSDNDLISVSLSFFRLITDCLFTGQAICKGSPQPHLLRPREKNDSSIRKSTSLQSQDYALGICSVTCIVISYVLLHKNRLLCLRRFLIIMRRTNISNFSFEQSFHPQSRGSTPQGYPFLNVQYLGTKMSSYRLMAKLSVSPEM